MPCYDGRDSSDSYQEGKESARHNSDVAEMLCAICKQAGTQNSWLWTIPGLKTWWVEHQKRDAAKAKREAEYKRAELLNAERAAKEALAKLKKLRVR